MRRQCRTNEFVFEDRVMQLFTSYYAMCRRLPDESKLVGISLDGGRLARFDGRIYKKLAPPPELLKHWHEHHDIEYYTKAFNEQVLARLNPHAVAEELGDGAILLCYEKSGDFCHRHLVAEWLRAAGIPCAEIKF